VCQAGGQAGGQAGLKAARGEPTVKKVLRVVMVAAALSFAPEADAQVALDFKVGYAIPFGNIQQKAPVVPSNWPMTDWWSGAIPLEVAGRYRFTPNFSAGVYFQWNPAFVSSTACGSGASCSGHDMRLGVVMVYDFIPDEAVNPWFSLGMGWEWSQASVTAGGVVGTLNVNGWEFPVAQAGVDFVLSKTFALGPYVGFFGGTYTNLTYGSGSSESRWAVDPSSRAYHGWLQLGLKGTLSL
jgi:hypothetical protein